MSTLSSQTIKQIPTTSDTVYAFDITGHVSDDDAEAMAEFMNDVFDRHEKVNMLLRLDGYTGSDKDALFDGDVIESRWRSLFKVGKYAVVGAPEGASKMIGFMDKILPVEAKAFETAQEIAAWEFVGARPTDANPTSRAS
ncbi:STAS/SEC14 domain-containing protein [Tropicimonas sp. S265A]|uniref:STAS/SEC14 domain-containing protein n=1 Tax=Tropicimonas sp. S265A TaxID=3415134 RepID=UPI003C7C5D75